MFELEMKVLIKDSFDFDKNNLFQVSWDFIKLDNQLFNLVFFCHNIILTLSLNSKLIGHILKNTLKFCNSEKSLNFVH